MKRPLVLAVDDDPAVLEAVEALLEPAFREIARFEAFSSGGEVVERVARWAEEDRRIAVAVVDQRMPGWSGVRLLAELRAAARAAPAGDHPAAAMQAILLSGQASVDEVLAALHEGRVFRYLRKPWEPEELRQAVAAGLSRFLARTAMDGWLEARFTGEGIELHEREPGGGRPRGTLAVECGGPGNPLPRGLETQGDVALPPALARSLGEGEGAALLGFPRVDPRVHDPVAAARFLQEAGLARLPALGCGNALVAASPPRALAWRRLGFVPVGDAEPGPDGERRVLLWGRPDAVPARPVGLGPLLEAVARGRDPCRCRSWPRCVPDAFPGDDTERADVLCPRRAAGVLVTAKEARGRCADR